MTERDYESATIRAKRPFSDVFGLVDTPASSKKVRRGAGNSEMSEMSSSQVDMGYVRGIFKSPDRFLRSSVKSFI